MRVPPALVAVLLIAAGCSADESASESGGPHVQDIRAAKPLSTAPSGRAVFELDEQSLDRLCGANGKAVVFVFTRVECPIANRYAPEIRRLYEKFTPHGVSFELIYPESSDSAGAIRDHLASYEYRCEAWRDPAHAAVRRFGAKVTPEVAVVDGRSQKMVYRGRIDDLYVDLGQARRAPTTHDLEEVLDSLVAGRSVSLTTTAAVGCSISDSP
ncbi:MAG TPA: redoxin domain-containing protein [Pirellulales bacterium]|nr:redoxin domain-containing protein [Pirellulales bacterium]